MTYDQWMRQVDLEVQKIAGVSVHDLSDFTSYDLYNAGDSPQEAARQALRADSIFYVFSDD